MHKLLLACLFSLALCMPATAQQQTKPTVSIIHSGDDTVGKDLLRQLLKDLLESPDFRMKDDGDNGARLLIHFVSYEWDRTRPKAATVTTAVVVFAEDGLPGSGYMLTGNARTCPPEALGSCSAEIVASLRRVSDQLAKSHPALYQRLLRK